MCRTCRCRRRPPMIAWSGWPGRTRATRDAATWVSVHRLRARIGLDAGMAKAARTDGSRTRYDSTNGATTDGRGKGAGGPPGRNHRMRRRQSPYAHRPTRSSVRAAAASNLTRSSSPTRSSPPPAALPQQPTPAGASNPTPSRRSSLRAAALRPAAAAPAQPPAACPRLATTHLVATVAGAGRVTGLARWRAVDEAPVSHCASSPTDPRRRRHAMAAARPPITDDTAGLLAGAARCCSMARSHDPVAFLHAYRTCKTRDRPRPAGGPRPTRGRGRSWLRALPVDQVGAGPRGVARRAHCRGPGCSTPDAVPRLLYPCVRARPGRTTGRAAPPDASRDRAC